MGSQDKGGLSSHTISGSSIYNPPCGAMVEGMVVSGGDGFGVFLDVVDMGRS